MAHQHPMRTHLLPCTSSLARLYVDVTTSRIFPQLLTLLFACSISLCTTRAQLDGLLIFRINCLQGNREGQTVFDRVLYPWSAFHSDDYGYTKMSILNKTHLSLQQTSVNQVACCPMVTDQVACCLSVSVIRQRVGRGRLCLGSWLQEGGTCAFCASMLSLFLCRVHLVVAAWYLIANVISFGLIHEILLHQSCDVVTWMVYRGQFWEKICGVL